MAPVATSSENEKQMNIANSPMADPQIAPKNGYLNDALQIHSPCIENILDAISFWAKHTPEAPALSYPSAPDVSKVQIVSWKEYEVRL